MYKLIIPTVLGDIAIVEQGGKITHLFLHAQQAPAHAPQAQTPLLRQAARQINEFFAGTRFYFDLPLAAHGTDFERQVWDVLCTIPYGQTLSYGAVARRLGRPGAARAVGRACHQNPIALLIPCHRVVGANGALTGYAGGLDIKRKLLLLENLQARIF